MEYIHVEYMTQPTKFYTSNLNFCVKMGINDPLYREMRHKAFLTLWTRRAGLVAYANGGAKNPTGQFSGICYGVKNPKSI